MSRLFCHAYHLHTIDLLLLLARGVGLLFYATGYTLFFSLTLSHTQTHSHTFTQTGESCNRCHNQISISTRFPYAKFIYRNRARPGQKIIVDRSHSHAHSASQSIPVPLTLIRPALAKKEATHNKPNKA